MKKRFDQKAFTLIEVMTTMAIIGLSAALAIPNALRMRLNANEAVAQSTLRSINTAMESYRLSNAAYPSDLSVLTAGAAGPGYLDEAITNGRKSGYLFAIVAADQDTYRVTASPESAGVTGNRSFALTESGLIQITHSADTAMPDTVTP